MSVELGVFVFPGRHTAKRVLDDVRKRKLAWIEDVAVVELPRRGNAIVHSTWAQNDPDRRGLGLGVLTGALVGAITGPAGIVAGALVGGAGVGLLTADFDVFAFDPRLAELAAALEPNTSALMLWANPTDVGAFVAAFAAHDAKLIRSSLSDERALQLKAALSGEGQS